MSEIDSAGRARSWRGYSPHNQSQENTNVDIKPRPLMINGMRSALGYLDDGRRQVTAYYVDMERLCEFETLEDGTWQPKMNPDGTFAMRITDDDLMGAA